MKAKTLALSILLVAASSTLALAHDRDRSDRAFQYGEQQGYEDGYRHGREDNERRLDYDLKSDDYKKADRGYRKEYGNKNDYKKGYKRGYQQGYDDGYGRSLSQRDRFPEGRDRDRDRRTGLARAYQFGYERGEHDGTLKGQEDRARNRDFDPQRHSDYRKADRGYEKDMGSKHDYQDGYRDGFLRGYEDGYGGRSRRARRGNRWGDVLGNIFGRRP